jgi:phosphoglycerate kinase
MAVKTIADLDLQGRRVFIRLDLNVPITPAGGVSDPTKIRACLPTIKHAVDQGGRVVLATHLGNPVGRERSEFSLLPLAAYLAECLDRELVLADEPAGDGAKKVVNDLRDGSIAMLENLYFTPAEANNDEVFSRMLASYADVYVNDAISTLHRANASTVGMVRHVSTKGIGFQLERELQNLGKLVGEVEHPFVVILGGAKVAIKLSLLESLLERVDVICMGGVMANTFLAAQGIPMGYSVVEHAKLPWARAFLVKAEAAGVRVVFPRDLVVAKDIKAESGHIVPATAIPAEMAAYDLGPKSVMDLAGILSHAGTILWNGPLGVLENTTFCAATQAVAKTIASTLGGTKVVVGDETVTTVQNLGIAADLTHLSMGSTAALEYIEGKKLPGLAALES